MKPAWLLACQGELASCGPVRMQLGRDGLCTLAPTDGQPSVTLALSLNAARTLAAAQPAAVVWCLSDGQGQALHLRWPLLASVCQGQGMALQLWRVHHDPGAQQGAHAACALLRRAHVAAPSVHGQAHAMLGDLLARMVRQAWLDHTQGLTQHTPTHRPRGHGASPCSLSAQPQGAEATLPVHPLWTRFQGRLRAFVQRQKARCLSERWRVGLVDAPISAWLDPAFRPRVRWLTPADRHRYHADPVGMIGSPRMLFCEEFDEATGSGRLVRLTLDAQGHVHTSACLDMGDNRHVSFPQLLADQGRVLGLLESSASRSCVLYEVDAAGQWRRLSTLLDGVAAVDPTLFRWEGRYWLAYTDADLGEHDNLCLRHAERLQGPWHPHANNPVRTDIRGARMAGGFFEHDGALYRPAQDCLGSYGAGVVVHRIVRCTPTEFEEHEVRRVTPDADGHCPDGLHTLSAWGEQTLIDGKRLGISARTLRRKLLRRLGCMPRASAPASAPPALRHVAVVVPHLRMGGGEISMLRIASGLVRLGVKVELIVNTLRTAEVPVPEGVQLTELGCEGTLSATRALAMALRRSAPQLVFSAFPHTNVATVAAVRWADVGARCVVSEHAPLSMQIQREGGWRYRVLPPLVRWAYRRADAVVAVSRGVATDLQTLLGTRPTLHVLANPVLDDTEQLDPLADPGHAWLSDPALQVVISVSRLSAEKDIPTLMRAFAQVHAARPHTRLLLVGEGPDRPRLQALRAELGLDAAVQLPGRITHPRRWVQHAAVFALASQYEGFGNVLIEALSCGVPVVSTDCPVGPRDILADGQHGRLVPVGDAPAMAHALMAALDDPHLPAGAREHAQGFTASRASLAYFQLFSSLLAGRPCC